MAYYFPILLIVLANTCYHISAKSTPTKVNPFFFQCLLYFLALCYSLVIYLISIKGNMSGIREQFNFLNWTPFVFAGGIVLLELGNILMYRVGWDISVGSTVCNILLAVILIFVSHFLYHEPIALKQILGIGLCLAGLVLINTK